MDMMTTDKTVKRRQYSDELKARVVAECDETGASVAKVAMSPTMTEATSSLTRASMRNDGGHVDNGLALRVVSVVEEKLVHPRTAKAHGIMINKPCNLTVLFNAAVK